jgi:hypothetical protein
MFGIISGIYNSEKQTKHPNKIETLPQIERDNDVYYPDIESRDKSSAKQAQTDCSILFLSIPQAYITEPLNLF